MHKVVLPEDLVDPETLILDQVCLITSVLRFLVVFYDGHIVETSNICRKERRWASSLARMGRSFWVFFVTAHLVKAST